MMGQAHPQLPNTPGPPLNLSLNLDLSLNVLFFGRVEAYKGVDTLLAAWAEALRRIFVQIRLIRGKQLVSSSPGRWRRT